MKIDADQIYFKEKLLDIRDALLTDINDKRNIDQKILSFIKIDKIAWYIPIKKIRNKFRAYFIKKIFNKNITPEMFTYEELFSFKEMIIYNRIMRADNFSLELGGFNTIINNGILSLYTNDYAIFNGCTRDHNIWIPDSSYKYKLNISTSLEIINKLKPPVEIGFCWIHFGLIKRKMTLNSKQNIDILDTPNIFWKDIEHLIISIKETTPDLEFLKTCYLNFGKNYFDKDKQYLTKEFYYRYLKKPLEYAIKNKENFIKRLW